MDFLMPEAQVLAWTILVFLALLAILWKFAWQRIMGALGEREQRIQHRIDSAARQDQEAAALKAECERRLARILEEGAQLIEQRKKAAEETAAQIIAAAEADAAKVLERTRREIALEKDKAVHELRERSVRIAALLAAQVIRREVRAEDHRRFIQEAMGEIEKAVG